MMIRCLSVVVLLGFLLCGSLQSATALSTDKAYILEQSRETVNQVNWEGAFAPEETAYVVVHHEARSGATDEDAERLLGIRVLLQTLYLTETTRPVVAILSTTVSHTTEQVLVDDAAEKGYKLLVKRRSMITSSDCCEHKFMWLHAWGLVDYKRVVHLGVGTLIMLNMDELFLCGEFCQLFSSWLYFSDLITVLKPDDEQYLQLLHTFKENMVGMQADGNLYYSANECDDKSQHFFMTYFGGDYPTSSYRDNQQRSHVGLSKAHLFDETAGQSHELVERLAYKYNMNAIHYYEYFNFDLYRTQEYQDLVIPAHSLGFWGEKPFRWERCLYFDLHWEYQAWRTELIDTEDFTWWVLSRATGLVVAWVFIRFQMPKLVTQFTNKFPHLRRFLLTQAKRVFSLAYGYDCVAFLVGGVVSWYTSIFLMYWSGLFPGLIPPTLAWPMFILWQSLTCFAVLKCIALLFADYTDAYNTDQLRWLPSMGVSILVAGAALYSCVSDVHFQFGEKIAVMYLMISFSLLSQVLVFRKYFMHLKQECVDNRFTTHKN